MDDKCLDQGMLEGFFWKKLEFLLEMENEICWLNSMNHSNFATFALSSTLAICRAELKYLV